MTMSILCIYKKSGGNDMNTITQIFTGENGSLNLGITVIAGMVCIAYIAKNGYKLHAISQYGEINLEPQNNMCKNVIEKDNSKIENNEATK